MQSGCGLFKYRMSNSITTLTLFNYSGRKDKLWGFAMMQFAHRPLRKVKGQRFYKLMGSGRGLGFDPRPDWSVYALLQVWDTEASARVFFSEHAIMKRYDAHSRQRTSLFLKNVKAHGLWAGLRPFEVSSRLDENEKRLLVITRAVIRTRSLIRFWRYVPTSQRPIVNAQGLRYTKGIGEVPLKNMSTVTVWEDEESMKAFAYGSEEHMKAIKMTRDLGWYSEELFARFQPYDQLGKWDGLALFPASKFQ